MNFYLKLISSNRVPQLPIFSDIAGTNEFSNPTRAARPQHRSSIRQKYDHPDPPRMHTKLTLYLRSAGKPIYI